MPEHDLAHHETGPCGTVERIQAILDEDDHLTPETKQALGELVAVAYNQFRRDRPGL
jgi:hypothetical protein